jgi:methylmalonyl-CoA mutase N-terminal domain/subunit
MLWVSAQALTRETAEKSRKERKVIWESGADTIYLSSGDVNRTGCDPDHPLAKYDAGYSPENYSWKRIEADLKGIDITTSIITFHGASSQQDDVLCVSQLATVAEMWGVDKKQIRGSCINDPISNAATGFSVDFPLDIGRRLNGDLTEYICKEMLKFSPFAPIAYDLWEAGCNSVQQLGIILSSVSAYCQEAIDRGVPFEQVGNRVTISIASSLDFFETVCKLRAARRMWAKIARERFGATSDKACRLRIAVRTPGQTITRQQPLNNIARIGFQAMAAIIGGCNAMDYARHDEAFCIPSEESSVITLALNHIIAQETGVGLTADPLGGSYYVEWLTNKLEEEAFKLMKEIEGLGGIWTVAQNGWLRKYVNAARDERLGGLADGSIPQVGVNFFRLPDAKEPDIVEYEFKDFDKTQATLFEEVKQYKANRDIKKTRAALLKLREKAKTKENLIYYIVDCFKADATRSEILGMIREAFGYSYDTVGMIERPKFLN